MFEVEEDLRVGYFIFNIPPMLTCAVLLEIERELKIIQHSLCEFRTVKQF